MVGVKQPPPFRHFCDGGCKFNTPDQCLPLSLKTTRFFYPLCGSSDLTQSLFLGYCVLPFLTEGELKKIEEIEVNEKNV